MIQCPNCNGYGSVRGHLCRDCNGTGRNPAIMFVLATIIILCFLYAIAGIVNAATQAMIETTYASHF